MKSKRGSVWNFCRNSHYSLNKTQSIDLANSLNCIRTINGLASALEMNERITILADEDFSGIDFENIYHQIQKNLAKIEDAEQGKGEGKVAA